MEKVDVLILGAGVVGLAIAARLSRQPGLAVAIVERHTTYGQETSSRNSEVIHAGLYYSPGSWKARLCVAGNRLLYDFCRQNDVAHARLGKIIVAPETEDLPRLRALWDNARNNGVNDLEWWEAAKVKSEEPDVECLAGLYSPSSGIVDTHGFMSALALQAQQQGAVMAYATEATEARQNTSGWEARMQDGFTIQTRVIINSTGLNAERVAMLAGLDTGIAGYHLHFCKGSYFRSTRPIAVRHLVYPVPDKHSPSLGIHLTKDLAGGTRFGPDAEYVDTLDYTVDEAKQSTFVAAIQGYLPSIGQPDLQPDLAGIRPKLQGPGEAVRDFIVRDETDRGFHGWMNLLGIESPGLTCSLALAERVAGMVLKQP